MLDGASGLQGLRSDKQALEIQAAQGGVQTHRIRVRGDYYIKRLCSKI